MHDNNYNFDDDSKRLTTKTHPTILYTKIFPSLGKIKFIKAIQFLILLNKLKAILIFFNSIGP